MPVVGIRQVNLHDPVSNHIEIRFARDEEGDISPFKGQVGLGEQRRPGGNDKRKGAMSVLLGCIADDFTGGTDIANILVARGMRIIQVIGVPDGPIDPEDADAVVVALKWGNFGAEEFFSKALGMLP